MRAYQPDQPKHLFDRKQGFLWLYLLLALIICEVVVILFVNTPRTMPVFLFFFVLLVGLSLGLGRKRALFVWLAMMFVWVTIKRFLGDWSAGMLMYNLLEVVLMLAISWIGGAYRDRQLQIWVSYVENGMRLSTLQGEDHSIGLLEQQLGMLRLKEEEERGFLYQRPLGLLLLQVQIVSSVEEDPREKLMILKAVATALKDTAREADIPFQLGKGRMGLILPETDLDSIQLILDRLIINLQDLRYVQETGEAYPVSNLAQVRYGYAVYLGQSDDPPDLLRAGLKSLAHSIKINQGPVYQNLFIESQVLGSMPTRLSRVQDARNK